MKQLLAALLLACAACGHTQREVFLLRHAEKATDDPKDPSLSEKGAARAESLAALLAKARVTHVFATEYKRTQATVAPLAKALGLSVTTVSSKEPEKQIELLRALPAGSRAVVAGHSNTLPGLVKALGADLDELETVEGEARLVDSAYDRLFLLILVEGEKPAVIELRLPSP